MWRATCQGWLRYEILPELALHGMGVADSRSRLVPQPCERFTQPRECAMSSALGRCR